jgi:hypothetical protein
LGRQALQAPTEQADGGGFMDTKLAALGLMPHRAPHVAVVTRARIQTLRKAEGV